MLAHHRKSVCLSILSTDLPVQSTVHSTAFVYQKDKERFHLLLSQQTLPQSVTEEAIAPSDQGLLWLEISPYRVIMTMQGNGKFSYRHFWETGVYGVSRYWLNGDPPESITSMRLRNFTRSLKLEGSPLPQSLRVEYELWSAKVQLGSYVLRLDIAH